jgi:DNA-binding transcriptional regulator/RsmH inhibitor MraZ
MFVGRFKLSIDGSRIVLPKDIFNELGTRDLILFCNDQKEIFFYNADSLKEFTKTISLDPQRIPKKVSRMLAEARKAHVDAKRRVTLPQQLMKAARLEQSCFLMGKAHSCVLNRTGHP